MDTAEEDEMRRALMQQGVLLGRHQEEISASWRAYSEISLQLNQLVERVDQLHTIPPAAPMATPPPNPDGTSNRRTEPRLNPQSSTIFRYAVLLFMPRGSVVCARVSLN